MDVFDFLSSYKEKPRLVSPVTYQGAKVRLASEIVDRIGVGPDQVFYDVCCGGGSITLELLNRGHPANNIVMVDIGPWGVFWKTLAEGTFRMVDFDQWLSQVPNDLCKIPDWMAEVSALPATEEVIPYLFPLLQAAAFGGKAIGLKGTSWVRGDTGGALTQGWRRYWTPTATSDRRSPVNPMMPMPNTIRERVVSLIGPMEGVIVVQGNAVDLEPRDGIVYVDPPYLGTTGYAEEFDFDLPPLWASRGCDVWVSEGRPVSENAVCISRGRSKGGVSGKRKKANEEWLSYFPSQEVTK